MTKTSKEDDFGWRLYYNPDVTDIDSDIKEIKINELQKVQKKKTKIIFLKSAIRC